MGLGLGLFSAWMADVKNGSMCAFLGFRVYRVFN
jgi:hypothetical protein